MTSDLIDRARTGDEQAFRQLVEPYQRELQVHCYRMLGSVQDAEDAVQETLLTAWRSLGNYLERAAMRTWLYRIATSRCLNALRYASRRPQAASEYAFDAPVPSKLTEFPWLEPYPDALLADVPDSAPGPHARYEAKEAISLAFITALQVLPPRQRAVLIVRDVLGYSTTEAAGVLDISEQAVASALKRARATLTEHNQPSRARPVPPEPGSEAEQRLIAAFVRAYEAGDIEGVVALFSEDAWLTMPPHPQEYQGRELIGQFFSQAFGARSQPPRLIATRANGQPAFGRYLRDPHGGVMHATGVIVLEFAAERISVLAFFGGSCLSRFGLPRTLPA